MDGTFLFFYLKWYKTVGLNWTEPWLPYKEPMHDKLSPWMCGKCEYVWEALKTAKVDKEEIRLNLAALPTINLNFNDVQKHFTIELLPGTF